MTKLLPIALIAALASPAFAEGKLTYFTWSGYELPEFHEAFAKAHPDAVEVSVFGDDDDAFTKVKAGFHPDLAHPCYDKIARWNAEGLLQPIDTAGLRTGTRSSRPSATCPISRPAMARSGWCRGTGAIPRSSTAPT